MTDSLSPGEREELNALRPVGVAWEQRGKELAAAKARVAELEALVAEVLDAIPDDFSLFAHIAAVFGATSVPAASGPSGAESDASNPKLTAAETALDEAQERIAVLEKLANDTGAWLASTSQGATINYDEAWIVAGKIEAVALSANEEGQGE